MEASNANANKDWRTAKKDLKERLEFLVDNEFSSDIKFSFQNGDHIFAHKFPLSVSSPVFGAMFYGPLASKDEVIQILDCDHKDTFVEFLKYLYCEECELDWNNVFHILYLAKKYLVSSLAERCLKFLSQGITTNNALIILQQANNLGEEGLLQKCVEYICSNAKEVLKTEYFVNLDLEILKVILKQDELNIEEIELFKLIELWCKHKLDVIDGGDQDFNAKRKLLGNAVHLIRFPLMTAMEFSENCAQSGILMHKECCDIMCYLIRKKGSTIEDDNLVSTLILPHGFSSTKRQIGCLQPIIKVFSRKAKINTSHSSYLMYSANKPDVLGFEVDQPINLFGVTVFGNCDNVVNHLFVQDENRKKITKPETYLPVSCDCCPTNSCFSSVYSFKVFFQNSVAISAGKRYFIYVFLSGPAPARGEYINDTTSDVKTDEINFTFYNHGRKGTNDTSVNSRQFPEFWYMRKI